MRLRVSIAVAGGFTFILGCLAVRNQPHHSPIECLFSDPACSTAVWTYALSVLAALALIAALDAGKFAQVAATAAQRSLDHERAPLLALPACYLECDIKRTQSVFLNHVPEGFRPAREPVEGITYRRTKIHIRNVGRTMLANVTLTLKSISDSGGSNNPLEISVGTFAAGETAHLQINVKESICNDVKFEWESATAQLPRLPNSPDSKDAFQIYPQDPQLRFPFRMPKAGLQAVRQGPYATPVSEGEDSRN